MLWFIMTERICQLNSRYYLKVMYRDKEKQHKEYYQESVLNDKNLHRLKDVTMCITTVAVYNMFIP
jgi:hypothetical protein